MSSECFIKSVLKGRINKDPPDGQMERQVENMIGDILQTSQPFKMHSTILSPVVTNFTISYLDLKPVTISSTR